MKRHCVLIVGSDRDIDATQLPIADDLKHSGLEVMHATDVSIAAALLFVSRDLEAVIVDGSSNNAAQCVQCLSGIRPEVPIFLMVDGELERVIPDHQVVPVGVHLSAPAIDNLLSHYH